MNTNSLTKKQILILAIILILIAIGALLWAVAVDQPSRFVGGALIGVGLFSIIPFAVLQDIVAADRRKLKRTGKRIDARIDEVINDGAMKGVYIYYLKLSDPLDKNVKFESDPLTGESGDSDAVRQLVDHELRNGIDDIMKIPVYVDPADANHYFVDIPYNFGHIIRRK